MYKFLKSINSHISWHINGMKVESHQFCLKSWLEKRKFSNVSNLWPFLSACWNWKLVNRLKSINMQKKNFQIFFSLAADTLTWIFITQLLRQFYHVKKFQFIRQNLQFIWDKRKRWWCRRTILPTQTEFLCMTMMSRSLLSKKKLINKN